MRKKVLMIIDIDTEKQGISGVGPADFLSPVFKQAAKSISQLEGRPVEIYEVQVRKDVEDYNQDALIDVTAHEIGHALSRVFDLPGGMMSDPRTLGELVNRSVDDNRPGPHGPDCHCANPTLEQMGRIVTNEQLAWKLAHKIRPIDPATEKHAMDTYLTHMGEIAGRWNTLQAHSHSWNEHVDTVQLPEVEDCQREQEWEALWVSPLLDQDRMNQARCQCDTGICTDHLEKGCPREASREVDLWEYVEAMCEVCLHVCETSPQYQGEVHLEEVPVQ